MWAQQLLHLPAPCLISLNQYIPRTHSSFEGFPQYYCVIKAFQMLGSFWQQACLFWRKPLEVEFNTRWMASVFWVSPVGLWAEGRRTVWNGAHISQRPYGSLMIQREERSGLWTVHCTFSIEPFLVYLSRLSSFDDHVDCVVSLGQEGKLRTGR